MSVRLAQPHLFEAPGWIVTKDGDPTLLALHAAHYSRRPGRRMALALGPGRKLALVTTCGRAAFGWRLADFRNDGEHGLECAFFRNESPILSSALILEAEAIAADIFGPIRRFTFVDPTRVKSSNPGFCFIAAGWTRLKRRTRRGLVILERQP